MDLKKDCSVNKLMKDFKFYVDGQNACEANDLLKNIQ